VEEEEEEKKETGATCREIESRQGRVEGFFLKK
jgi:hypothetical protein